MIDQLLSDRAAGNGSTRATAAANGLRTPPSTRVPHLYAPVEREAARSLQFATASRDRDGAPRPVEPDTRLRLEDVLEIAAKFVTPFYGVATLDMNRTVQSFVENLESVMGDVLPP